jgi:hypothetical protein
LTASGICGGIDAVLASFDRPRNEASRSFADSRKAFCAKVRVGEPYARVYHASGGGAWRRRLSRRNLRWGGGEKKNVKGEKATAFLLC